MVEEVKMTKKRMMKLEKKERNKLDKEWREKVKAEFNNKCIIPGCNNITRLNCHHLFPRENKLFRHEVLNGVVLCATHHKWSLDNSPHKNPLVFLNFYMTNFKDRYERLYVLYLNTLTQRPQSVQLIHNN